MLCLRYFVIQRALLSPAATDTKSTAFICIYFYGLDLVKCVAKYIHARGAAPAASSPAQYTTERSHSDDMYSPTPEQNYEIEESVSVMSNGRAHGIVGSVTGRFTTTTTSRPIARNRLRNGYQHGSQTNANNHNHHHHQHHSNADYDDDGSYNYDDDNDEAHKTKQENADDDDSKVAYVVEGQNYRKYRVEEKTDDGFIVGEYGVVDHNDGNLRGVRYTADSTINPSLIQKALLTFLKLK